MVGRDKFACVLNKPPHQHPPLRIFHVPTQRIPPPEAPPSHTACPPTCHLFHAFMTSILITVTCEQAPPTQCLEMIPGTGHYAWHFGTTYWIKLNKEEGTWTYLTNSLLFLFTEPENSVTFYWTYNISTSSYNRLQPRNTIALKWDCVLINGIKLSGTPIFNSWFSRKRL